MVEPSVSEFGWFLPTAGDTTAYGLASAPDPARRWSCFDKIVGAAEAAGFRVHAGAGPDRLLGGVDLQRHDGGALEVDAHAGGGAADYINPVLLAKMITAFDQLSAAASAST